VFSASTHRAAWGWVLAAAVCATPVNATARTAETSGRSGGARLRVAVGGFTNDQTVEPRDAWLATAIEESLAFRLARVPGLIVVPPPRMHQARRELTDDGESPPTAADLARALGAQVLISGRCGGHSDSVTLELQISRLSGQPNQSEPSDSLSIRCGKLLEVLDRATEAVLDKLNAGKLQPSALQRVAAATTRSPSALEYHARALEAARAEQFEDAYHYARRALEYDEEYRPALATLAQLEIQGGPPAHPSAGRHLFRLMELARQADDPVDRAAAELGQGVILHVSGAFEAAYLRYESALALSFQYDLPYGQLAALNSIVELCLTRRMPPQVQPSADQAQRYVRQNLLEAGCWQQVALDLVTELEDAVGQMTAALRLALIYERLDETEAALGLHRQALALAQRLGSRRNQATGWLHIAQCLQRDQKLTEAVEAMRHCLELAPTDLQPAARLALAGIHQKMSQPEQALSELEQAWSLLRAGGSLESQLRCARDVAILRRQLGRTEAALEALREASQIAHALGSPEEPVLKSLLEQWTNQSDR
jgi:tetratricopeptide (TPR) repeat protein